MITSDETADTRADLTLPVVVPTPQHEAVSHPQPVRALWLGPCAWALALLGLVLYGGPEPWRTLGLLILPMSAAFVALLWRGWRVPRSFAPRSLLTDAAGRPRRLSLGVASALATVLVADLLALVFSKEPFGLAGVVWLASIGLLLYGTYSRLPAPAPPREGEDLEMYALSPGVPWPRWEIAALVGLVALAAILRLWDLSSFPFNVYPDEVMSGTVASDAYLNPALQAPSVFSTVWGDVDLPALWFLLLAGVIKLAGPWLWALRLLPALFGTATIVPFYALVRSNWGRAAALCGTVVLAFRASNIHYSRVALNNIVTPFFWTLCFYFLLRGLRTRRAFDWVCAGLAAGLSEYGFYGTRLLPFVLVGFFIYLLVVRGRAARRFVPHFGLLAVGYVVGFGPLLAYFLRNPKVYFGHGVSRLLFDHFPRSLSEAGEMAATLWSVLGDNLLGLSSRASQETIYFAPFLFPVEAALLVLGVGLLVWRWRNPASFLMLLSGLGIIFVGGTLVRDAPGFNHWAPAFSAFYVAVALPLGAWAGSVRNMLPLPTRRVAYAALGAALAVLGLANVVFYFAIYYADPNVLVKEPYRVAQGYYEIETVQSRFQASLGPSYVIRAVGVASPPYDPAITLALVGGQDWAKLVAPESELPVQVPRGKGLAFIFFEGNEHYRDLVRSAHPGGKDGEVLTPRGKHLFYTYLLPPAP